MMKVQGRLLVAVAVMATCGVAHAGTPCASDWECPGWGECIQGECHEESPGVQICDSTGQEGDPCPEGCECINDGCVCEGSNLVGCSTGADCTTPEDCVKGACVGHEVGGLHASCDAVDECFEKQVCVRHRCEDRVDYCSSDDDCHDVESCALECVLYEYGPDGSFDGATCISELGKCEIDLSKIDLKQECDPFCEKIGPCWEEEDGGNEEGPISIPVDEGGKEDTITDGSDMVLECKYMCSILLADPAHQPSMDAAIACLADVEGDCADFESTCESELGAAFGGQSASKGGPDANASVEDVVSGDSAPKTTSTGSGGGGSCTVAPSAPAPASGLLLLLLAAFFFVVRGLWQER